MNPIEDDAASLRQHITHTYLSLRIGIAAIGVSLPPVLWLGGKYVDPAGRSLLGSMSMYYHTGMRDIFVGALAALSVCLYLYKGFSRQENWALNLAGIFGVCVALIPTQNQLIDEVTTRTWFNQVHVASAILFFMCIAYVSVFRASDTLSLIRDTEHARKLRSVYWSLGALMIALPLAALVVADVFTTPGTGSKRIFYLEAAGVWAFASYWLAKSWELSRTDAERAAGEGKLEAEPAARDRGRAPGRLIQTPLNDGPMLSAFAIRAGSPDAVQVGSRAFGKR